MKYNKTINPDKVFFTSDTHFGHTNIIKYCDRPFNTTNEMDETLIRNWNSVVPQDGLVFHLGDFAFGDPAVYRPRLNGDIRFIIGNHDRDSEAYYYNAPKDAKPFLSYEDVRMVVINGQAIWLSHYAHRVWPKQGRKSWHLYGHSHNNLPDDKHSLSFDVGVDAHGFKPISFKEVAHIMGKKEFKTPEDHHGNNGD